MVTVLEVAYHLDEKKHLRPDHHRHDSSRLGRCVETLRVELAVVSCRDAKRETGTETGSVTDWTTLTLTLTLTWNGNGNEKATWTWT